MSKLKCTVKRESLVDDYNETLDEYLAEFEEGEYVQKKLSRRGVKKIYIYSTLADVDISSSATEKITATLQGELYGEQFYFTMFRLDNTVYVYATCDVDRFQSCRLFVTVPETTEYKLEIVTNRASVTVRRDVPVKKLKIKAGKRLQKKG